MKIQKNPKVTISSDGEVLIEDGVFDAEGGQIDFRCAGLAAIDFAMGALEKLKSETEKMLGI